MEFWKPRDWLVALGRLRRCPAEVKDEFWPPDKEKPKRGRPTKPKGSQATSGSASLIGERSPPIEQNVPVSREMDPPRQLDPPGKWAG